MWMNFVECLTNNLCFSKFVIEILQLLIQIFLVEVMPCVFNHLFQYTSSVVNKANAVRGFLQCNLTKCPLPIKSSCYLSLVRPILEYACAIWSPYYQCNIHQVETVQRRAARYVMNNFNSHASVSEMIATLGWPTLEKRRKTDS